MKENSLVSNDLVERDFAHVWHPCTQMKDHEQFPIIPVASGQGVWLEDFDGNKYIDAISSWWVNIFGHANKTISDAISQQAQQLEHVLLAGFSHQPIIHLSEQLVELTPEPLQKCFYADNGSSAVEVSLKMSFHYWKNIGKPNKKKFVTLQNSYHGETLGAMSVSDVELYIDTYKPLLLDSFTVPVADSYNMEPGEQTDEYVLRMFAHMEKTLREHHEEISAVIVEPLVQCAGSMRMYDARYLTLLRAACDKYDVHLIADEIAVGFGRTGTMFACEQADISPDFMCLSKGLTGGYLPLSAVLTTNKVYDAFYDDYESMRAFLHSHSYTGNPLACAAALATLSIFHNNDTIQRNQGLIQRIKENGQRFDDHPNIAQVRQTGMIFAIEMVKDKVTKTPYPWQQRRGLKAYKHALKNHILLRPLGNVLYFMPPYVIDYEQIDLVMEVMEEAVNVAVED
ncbi:MAG: adenosylmethionine--8-amino-7-oxononanoate transaminase [Gammaproteobacteria bacterium]